MWKKRVVSALAIATLSWSMANGAKPEKNPDFALVQKHLDTDGSLYIYVDADSFFESLAEEVDGIFEVIIGIEDEEFANRREEFQTAREGFDRVYDKLGLTAIKGYGVSSRKEPNGIFLTRTFLHLETDSVGLPALLVQQSPRERASVHFAPADSAFYLSFDTSLKNAKPAIEALIEAGSPNKGAAMSSIGLGFVSAYTGLDLKPIMDAIDGEIVLSFVFDSTKTISVGMKPTMPPVEIAYPTLLLSIEMDSPTLKDQLLSLLERRNIEVSDSDASGVTYHSFTIKGATEDITSTIAFDGSKFYYTTSQDALVEAIERSRSDQGGLADDSEFRKYTTGFPDKSNSLLYISPNAMDSIDTALRDLLKQENESEDIPPHILKKVTRPFLTAYGIYPRAMVRTSVPDGVAWTERANADMRLILAQKMISPFFVPLTAVAVPNFIEARARAQRSRCRIQLIRINEAKQEWAVANSIPVGGEPTWENLIGPTTSLQAQPVCPAGGVYTINPIGEAPECSLKDQPGDSPHTYPNPR